MKTITVKLPGQAPATLAASGFCSPCEAATLQAQTAAVQKTYQNNELFAAGSEDQDRSNEIPWSGEIGFESQFTGDGRYINEGALRWDEAQMPMPLRWAPTDVGAHGGAVVVGLITEMAIKDGKVLAKGFIDSATEYGAKVIHGLSNGTLKGVSMDLDEMSFEIRVKQEVIDEVNAEINEMISGEAELSDEPIDIANGEKPDENGYTKVYEQKAMEEVMYVTDALVRAATIVDIPAFKNAYVALDSAEAVTAAAPSPTLVAAAPIAPTSAWFSDPKLDGPTPLTFTKDGRVFGHIALWGTCHTGFSGTCVTAPPSMTNYALFRTGALITAEGTEVAVGRITMDTGHAALGLSAGPAAAHYDNTGNAVADVSAGEDAHGIWVAGALRSTVTDEQLRALRSSPMSGDWRTSGGNLELVSVLAVNLPGFPVPRVSAMVASGRTASLIRPTETPIVEDQVKAPTAVESFAKAAQKARRASLAKKVGA